MLNSLDRFGAKVARGLNKPVNTFAALILGIFTMIWGIWIANPFWTVFDKADVYSWLSSVAPESFWGSLGMLCGFFIIFGIIRHTYASLTTGAFIGFVHWGLIAFGYFKGDRKSVV